MNTRLLVDKKTLSKEELFEDQRNNHYSKRTMVLLLAAMFGDSGRGKIYKKNKKIETFFFLPFCLWSHTRTTYNSVPWHPRATAADVRSSAVVENDSILFNVVGLGVEMKSFVLTFSQVGVSQNFHGVFVKCCGVYHFGGSIRASQTPFKEIPIEILLHSNETQHSLVFSR